MILKEYVLKVTFYLQKSITIKSSKTVRIVKNWRFHSPRQFLQIICSHEILLLIVPNNFHKHRNGHNIKFYSSKGIRNRTTSSGQLSVAGIGSQENLRRKTLNASFQKRSREENSENPSPSNSPMLSRSNKSLNEN